MVLSGSKKSTYMSSIVNQNQGGGNKKAGLLTRSVGVFHQRLSSFHGSCSRKLLHPFADNEEQIQPVPQPESSVGFNGAIRMR
jgi:hypothetical protein